MVASLYDKIHEKLTDTLAEQWERIDREAVASVLGFVERLLLKHFS
jgi:hypothetical protein